MTFKRICQRSVDMACNFSRDQKQSSTPKVLDYLRNQIKIKRIRIQSSDGKKFSNSKQLQKELQ